MGDVPARFEKCWHALRMSDGIEVLQTSPIYRSVPMGQFAGDAFCNAVAELKCDLSPPELLARLQELELQFGRQRDIRWGPRTLDLDILLFGNEIVQSPSLIIPHPGVIYRRFVLDPLSDIAASVCHPGCSCTIAELRSHLLKRPLPVAINISPPEQRDPIVRLVQSRFPQVVVVSDSEAAALTLFANALEGSPHVLKSSRLVDLSIINADWEAAAVDVLSAALG